MKINTTKNITATCVYAGQLARMILFVLSALLVLLLLPFPHGQAAQVGHEDRFGYNQLETAAQKRAYTILEEQIGNVAESFLVPAAEGITIEDMQAAADVLALDRPDYFYFIYGNMNILQFRDGMLVVNPRYILHKKATPKLSKEELLALAGQTNYAKGRSSMMDGVEETPGISLEEIRTAKQVYENKIGRILQSIPTEADTTHKKVKYLHDYLANMITYEFTSNDQNAYSAVVEEKTVCAGYARAYQDLVTRLGIKCWYITGYAGEAHAWNVLWLNGECVYTDVTWADQVTYIQYGYYNISKEQMDEDHTMDPEYAAVLGSCNHETHKHMLTPENVEGSVYSIQEYHFPQVGNDLVLDFSRVSNSVIFHTSDPSVVTVTDDGLITAEGEGSAVITIVLEDKGHAEQFFITVGVSHQHELMPVSEVSATCHSCGYKSHYVCNSCGKLFADAAGQQKITDKQLLMTPYNSDHGTLIHAKGTAATCTENGKKDYWYCIDCGECFFDSNGNKIIENFHDLLISATGHGIGNWQSNVNQHWKTCQECKQILEQSTASHTDADRNYRCDSCGYSLPVPETTPVQPNEPPTTKPAPTEPTQTEPPATEPPATESPATEPPATEPPATEPPATEPPATEPPATEPTASTDPASTESSAKPTDGTQSDEMQSATEGKGDANNSGGGATIAPTENGYLNDENDGGADLSVVIVATLLGVFLGAGMGIIVALKRKR